jgi:thioesterase domain-containing protein
LNSPPKVFIVARERGAISRMQMQDREVKYFEVVALREAGGQTSLFCLPGAGGNCTTFQVMASLMAEDQSIYGIDLQKFFETDRKFTTEQLADYCLSAIRRTQNCGPYHMCGYSFGAIIAYEVASRLKRAGEDVGVVALIDTGNPAFRFYLSSADIKRFHRTYVANRLGKYFRVLANGNFKSFANGLLSLFASRAGTRSRRLIRSLSRAVNRPMPTVLRNNDRALFEAWRAYNPPHSALSLLLVYGEHRCAEHGGDRTLGWGLCATGDVDVLLTSEGHVEMMQFPHVRSVAAKLSECLKRQAN